MHSNVCIVINLSIALCVILVNNVSPPKLNLLGPASSTVGNTIVQKYKLRVNNSFKPEKYVTLYNENMFFITPKNLKPMIKSALVLEKDGNLYTYTIISYLGKYKQKRF